MAKSSKKASTKSTGGGSSVKSYALIIVVIAALIGAGSFVVDKLGNVLSGFTGEAVLTMPQLQVVVSAFCLSPIPSMLLTPKRTYDGPGMSIQREFNQTGDVNEDDYTKDSIYALLYSLYQAFPNAPSPKGGNYQFTFNTWGISAVPWIRDETEPQRHGMAAYQGLVEFEAVKKIVKEVETPRFLEIGCGTGAGANLITQLIPTAHYTAVDMQKAAIKTCNELHGKGAGNDRLECLWVEGGVGNDGSKVAIPDESVDVVVISETHIAEADIGPEEKAIFADIVRVLKPGGIFVWGNALPTYVWNMAAEYLPKIGFEECGTLNHTKGAIQARDEDEERVNMYLDHLIDGFPVFKVPFFGPRCDHVSNMLVKNFYRHPGTALYEKMVTGYDSYMHLCNVKGPKATQEIF